MTVNPANLRDIYDDEACSRAYQGPCRGELFSRTSRSGMTVALICQGHAEKLEADLDAVAERYPEINHHVDCLCPGCIGDAP